MMTFNMWKTKTMRQLLQLYKKYQDPEIDMLIEKLSYLKKRDLITFMKQLHSISRKFPELLELLPSQEELESWLKG